MAKKDVLTAVSPARGVFSTLVVLVVIAGIITLIAHATGLDLRYQIYLFNVQGYMLPASLIAALPQKGMAATFALSLITGAENFLVALICSLVGFISTMLVTTYQRGLKFMKTAAPAPWPISSTSGPHLAAYHRWLIFRAGLRGEVNNVAAERALPREALEHQGEILFTPLPIVDLELRHTREPIRNLAPQYHIRLRRDESIIIKRPLKTPLNALEHALIRILAAHKDWSCDPAGHHGNQTLLAHSIKVAKAMEAGCKTNSGATDEMAFAIGLAHDIGKILAYKRITHPNGAKEWTKVAPIHDTLSALIVRSLGEYRALPVYERSAINLTLSYMHNPNSMPSNMSDLRVTNLINTVRTLDGLETREDRNLAHVEADKKAHQDELKKALESALAKLNINASRTAEAWPDGWYNPALPFVVVLANSLRKELESILPNSTTVALGFASHDHAGVQDPPTFAIAKALFDAGILGTVYDGVQAKSGLFNVRIGTKTFSNAWLLRQQPLAKQLKINTAEWGTCKYPIKVLDPMEAVAPAAAQTTPTATTAAEPAAQP